MIHLLEPRAAERAADAVLSFAQQRLWFLERLGAVGAAYNLSKWMRMEGGLDTAAFARALHRIVERHEVLRTTFHEVDGEPVQRVHPAERSGFQVVMDDLRGHADPEAELRRVLAEEASVAFDLERGPLFRARLMRVGAEEYAAVTTFHHIVADGWSAGVILRELGVLYGAFSRGEPDPIPPLPLQFAEYAAWQRERVDGELLRVQAEYWRNALAGAPALLELPADRARPARQEHAGDFAPVDFGEELTAGVKALARRHGTTPFVTLLAGWAAVLGRLSGSEDVVVGAPSSNRDRREVRTAIGFFVNTLALRVDLAGAPTVAELLARVKARVQGGQQHQDIPFEQVVEAVQPARSTAYTPLFQVLFAWQNTPRGRMELPGVRLGSLGTVTQDRAKFDLSLSLQEDDGRITGRLEYATSLFDRATVERYLRYLRTALAAMVADDGQTVDRLPLLSGGERRQVLEEWNDTDADYPRESCIHELFEAQVERTPDAVAVVHEDRSLTYAELNSRANRLAHHLRSLGVGPDARVAICLPRSAEMVVAVLAVLKAGGAFVPLDPAYPAERLRFMLDDSAPVALLAHGSPAGLPEPGGIPVIDPAGGTWTAWTDTNPPRAGLTPRHPAYITYTSGSTGQPKGVWAVHEKVLNLVHWYGRELGITADDSVLIVSSYSFDGTYRNLFAPLFAGARVHLAAEPFDPAAIAEQVARSGISLMNLTPTACAALVEASQGGELSGMRRIVLVGEPARARDLMRLPEPRPEILNLYGPTECSGITTFHRLSPDLGRYLERPVPAGRPIPNSRVYVLDPCGEPVPTGVAGEIHIGGVPVGPGYPGRPGLTAERYLPDPFGREPGARMYRTGDLGRWRADGTLEVLGRTDFQVKVRGFRVEPGEIEARLCEHPEVRAAVVAVRGGRLVAYIVGAAGAESLRAHLSERLPEHMVPAAYVGLDALPLTPSGKIDRRALPAPEGDAAIVTRAYEAPLGETETALAGIWTEVLKVERAGRHDHFFELGGHSLLAVQVVSRIRQLLAAEVSLRDVFVHPVLADLARAVEAAGQTALPAIVPAPAGERAVLSFAQRRLWFLDQFGGAGRAYHIPTRLRLRGELDRVALGCALDRIVERHEALRTTFRSVDGEPVQHVMPAEECCFLLVDHDLRGHDEPDAELRRLIAEEAGAPFDLVRGPLVRGSLIRLAGDEHVLLATMHHIVSDGWSMSVLVDELSALYGSFVRGGLDPLPPLAVQYADYAAWQRRQVDGEVLREQAEYWRATLTGAPELLALPTDRARPARQDHDGEFAGLELDEALTTGLKALGRRHGTTLFVTLVAGWAAVLGRLSGADDVVIGTPTANRGRKEIEGLIGFFVNTLALRVDLSGSPSVAELLGRVKARALEAQQHQDIPFEQVVEIVRPARNLAHGPLFQVLFAWQNTPKGDLGLPGLTLAPLGASRSTARNDLGLALREEGGRIVGGLTYATSLFDRATVERHLGYLRTALAAMVAGDRQAVDHLALLSADERHQVVEEWNETDADYPHDVCIHELFEAQVERTPEAVALVHEDRSLTYAELNSRANRLAHHLRSLGVSPDARVAVCAGRGVEMVMGMLAVLKAGGAYVPLDPSYPADRLRYMLEDSAPVVALACGPLAGLLGETGIPVVELDGDWPDQPSANPERGGLAPDHLAYVIYTSGSTGRPKGVMNHHRGAANLVAWSQQTWRLEPGDAVLQRLSFSFDVSVRELFWPLSVGARVVMAGEGGQNDPSHLVDILSRERIGAVHLVPSLLQVLLEHPEVERCPAGLRVLCGGEVLPPALARRFHERLPQAHLYQMYGPTETTVAVTARLCAAEEPGARVPLGRPVGNTRIYVLDRAGEPVPAGVAGELYVGGVQVARGYLHQPALTAQRFVIDPFSEVPGARMYRTGDLGRWAANGEIEFLGRNDEQVKVRGFRIELGEIEARLREHPDGPEAAVLVREDTPGDQRLVAYLAGSEPVEAEAVRAHLLARLPGYMVPAAYVWLQELPLTPNGKVDRKALPAPEGGVYAAREYEPPIGETETALAGIWSEVLGVERVGRHDHFFDLGGHSLVAIRLIHRARSEMEVEIALRDIFEAPVLSDLAARILDAQLAEFDPEELALLA